MRLIAALLAVACSASAAPGGFEFHKLLLCSTPAQIKHFIELGATPAALNSVAFSPTGGLCLQTSAAFVPLRDVEQVKSDIGTFKVLEVSVFGFKTKSGLNMLKDSQLWYTLVLPGESV